MEVTLRLLDREHELRTLEGALTAAAAGRGHVAMVEGAAGTGKSALLSHVCELADAAGVRALRARGGEMEGDSPFGLIRQLFELTFHQLPPAEREGLLDGAVAPAAGALGLANGKLDPQAAGFSVLHGIYWLAASLAASRPLALIVDDGHWADPSSLRALDYLARRIADVPICLVLALRPDEPSAPAALLENLTATPSAVRITMRPLSPVAVAHIVRDRIREADDTLCETYHQVTGGNPLYLHELLRALSLNGAIADSKDVLGGSVPSLGDRVLRRVHQAAPQAPTLARSMAVLGEGTRLRTAAAVAGVPEELAGDVAHRLRRMEVLSSEDPIEFVHPLIRRSIYDAIPVVQRQLAHREAARVLSETGVPAEAVAAHLRVLPPGGESMVAHALVQAAESALERAAPDEAAAWLERALAEEAPEPSRVHLLARYGLAKTLQRDPTAITYLREAFESAPPSPFRTRVGVVIAETLAHTGQWQAAHEVITALEHTLEVTDLETRTEVAALRGAITLYDPGQIGDFDRRRPEYLRLSEQDYWASHALRVLLAVEASRRGRTQEGLGLVKRALANGKLLGERGAGAWTAPQLLQVFIEADDLAGADAAIDQVESAAQSTGAILALISARGCRGWVHSRRGNLAEADAQLSAVMRLVQELGLVMGITTLAFCLIDVLLERSGLKETAQIIENLELTDDFLQTASGGMLLEARGALRLQRDELDAGIADLRAAGQVHAALGFGPTYSSWRSRLALVLPQALRDEALALVHEELDLARQADVARPQGIALRALGLLSRGPAGIDLLEESVSVLEPSPARLEHARSLVELGGALRRGNGRAGARRPLIRGMELAYHCGAQRLVERARDELVAAGGRPRRIATTGRDSLTASELRVARMAAGGATNPQIAQQLYVSLKTVETHLSHVYAKLGLTGAGSRARLQGALGSVTARAIT